LPFRLHATEENVLRFRAIPDWALHERMDSGSASVVETLELDGGRGLHDSTSSTSWPWTVGPETRRGSRDAMWRSSARSMKRTVGSGRVGLLLGDDDVDMGRRRRLRLPLSWRAVDADS
jgi:hypothetical protein